MKMPRMRPRSSRGIFDFRLSILDWFEPAAALAAGSGALVAGMPAPGWGILAWAAAEA